jgi:phospholipid/cholesterol/gamma-HCH transport system substrate-binding protein
MDKRARNIAALGLLTIVAAATLVYGVNFLSSRRFWEGSQDLIVSMSDAAGVKRGDRVVLQGVQVGTVSTVELTPSNDVVVILRVSEDLLLPADTRATVSGDVFGAHVVELIPGTALVRLEEGDTIRGMAALELMKLATGLGERAESVLISAENLLSREAVEDLHETAASLPATVRELRLAFTELRGAVVAMRATTEEFASAQTGAAVNQTLTQIQETARALTTAANGMSTAATSMDRSLQSFASVMAKIDTGSGTLGRLVNDSSLYLQVQTTVREMGELAADIRARPQRYISLRIF